MKRNLCIFCLCLLSTVAFSQTWNQYKKEAKKAFQNEEFGLTLYYLDTMQKIDSSKFDLIFLQAEAARYYNAFELSEKSFKKVLKNEKSEYFLPAMLGLATVQKMQGDYKNAINGFKNYLLLNPDSNSVEHIEAKNQIQACIWAMDLVKFNDKDLIISQLGNEVNTDFSDFAPVRYGDKLLFSSLRFSLTDNQKDNSKKYSKVLELKDGTTEAKEFELDISNKDLHSAHIAFNEAKNRMYFNICHFKEGNIINCKIYFRNQISDTVWTKPIALPENINQKNVTVTHPNIGIDESSGKEMLFFVSDRVGGMGGKDIWYAYLDEEGQPSNPINLKAINTGKDDLSPFFHNYTQTLYFSSDGRKSLGGLDIYKTVKNKDKWNEINHTGFPLNSSYNDVYFSLNQNGSEGFLSSNREGTLFLDKQISACCYDIFKAEFNSFIIDLKVLTFEEVNGQKIDLEGASVTVYELFDEAEKEIKYKISPEKNQHFFRINSNKKYRIEAKKLGLVTATLAFNTDNSIPDKEIIKELVLKKPELQILTFDQNLETALKGATVSLNELDDNGKVIAEIPLKKSLENSYHFPIDFYKNYEITVVKQGFEPVIQTFSTIDLPPNKLVLVKRIILYPLTTPEPIKRGRLKPFSLYFDNDYPKPGAVDTLTNFTFPVTLAAYKRKKDQYKAGFSKGLNGEQKIMAEYEVEKFFENEMDADYFEFLKFTDAVLKRLEFGRDVIISVQAYTSPLASESYNLKLSKRRISSMLNFYRSYKNGAMKKYVDEGKLRIEMIPLGETKSPDSISDNPNDKKNSVYSLDASKQRKVEIKEVATKRTDN